MIEFNGYLTGAAEKGFVRKSRNFAFFVLIFAVIFSYPMISAVGKYIVRDELFTRIMFIAVCFLPLCCFIPKGKQEHQSMLPKRVYVDDKHIVCVADRYTDSRLLSDVKKVIDRGEYYELFFVFGKMSEKYICQKSLLTKGSLTQFEALFSGKLHK